MFTVNQRIAFFSLSTYYYYLLYCYLELQYALEVRIARGSGRDGPARRKAGVRAIWHRGARVEGAFESVKDQLPWRGRDRRGCRLVPNQNFEETIDVANRLAVGRLGAPSQAFGSLSHDFGDHSIVDTGGIDLYKRQCTQYLCHAIMSAELLDGWLGVAMVNRPFAQSRVLV